MKVSDSDNALIKVGYLRTLKDILRLMLKRLKKFQVNKERDYNGRFYKTDESQRDS